MTTTQHTTHHVTIPVQVDRDELLGEVICTAWEYWDWWRTISYAQGYDSSTYPDDPDARFMLVGVENPDDPDKTIKRWLSVNDIVKATIAILTKYPHVRWNDWDTDSADLVFQQAMLGDVVYG